MKNHLSPFLHNANSSIILAAVKIVIIFLCLIPRVLLAQSDPSPFGPQVLPPPPGVAEIEKYGSIPTTPYTGLPSISIPIYTLKSKSASIPISLSYHAQGLKVNDVSGPVGLGWALNAGGYLTKAVNGLSDGTVSSGFTSIDEILTYANDQSEFDLKQMFCNLEATSTGSQARDNDVDIYSFSVPGASGKFFYDNDDVLRQMPVQNLKINNPVNSRYTLAGHEITDGNGVTYHFDAGDMETQEPLIAPGAIGTGPNGTQCIPNPSGISRTAKLSRITSFDGGEITFTYEDYSYNYLTSYNEFKIETDGIANFDLSNSVSWSGMKITTGKRLKKIESKEGYVIDFVYSSTEGPGEVSQISISYKGNRFKWFDLSHSLYRQNDANKPPFYPGNFYNKRSKLTSIIESGRGKHTFIYNNRALPPRFSYAQDYWGYYNGVDYNITLIPDKTIDGLIHNVQFATGSREADLNFMKAGILKEIIYPTGGSTKFDYDVNKRRWPEYDVEGCVSGFRSKSAFYELAAIGINCEDGNGGGVTGTIGSEVITIPVGATQIKALFSSNGVESDVPRFACENDTPINRSSILYIGGNHSFSGSSQSVNIPDGITSVTVDFMLNGYSDEIDEEGSPGSYELMSSRIRIVWQEPFTECPDNGDPMQSIGGLRLKSQLDKSATGDQPIIKYYSYSGTKYHLPRFTAQKEGYTRTSTVLLDGFIIPVECYSPISTPILVMYSNSLVPSNTLFGGSAIYDRVTEVYGDPTSINAPCLLVGKGELECLEASVLGKVEYTYDHVEDIIISHPINGYGTIVDRSHLRGQLLEQRVYGFNLNTENYFLKSHTINTYGKSNQYTHYGVIVELLRREKINPVECLDLRHPAMYDYFHYSHQSEWLHLDSTTTQEYFHNVNLTLTGSKAVITTYDYNLNNFLPRTVTTTYPDIEERVEYEYSLSQASGRVTNKEQWVKEIGYVNTEKLIREENNVYDNVGSEVNLVRQTISQGTQKVKDVSIEYDSEIRINKISNNVSGINTSFDYQDDDFISPSAQCTNCESVFHEGFESYEGALADVNAKSGDNVYDLSTGNVSIVAPPDYELSYWKKPSLNDSWIHSTDATFSGGFWTISGTGYIDNINAYPSEGQITTYTYKPGWGISSITDHNGKTVQYKFDQYGRLVRELDDDSNVLKEYQYHLVNFN